jgi:uncharacterized protein (TIGR00369 family)
MTEIEAAMTTTDLEAVLRGAAFAGMYGFRVVDAGVGSCTLEVPFREAFERPGGVVSGPVYMAAADAAMWLAILTRTGGDGHWVTVGMNSSFLRGARRSDLRCTATVLRLGTRIAHGLAEIVDHEGRLLAHHTLTYTLAQAR